MPTARYSQKGSVMEEYKEVEVGLEKLRVGFQQRVSLELLGASVTSSYDPMINSILVEIRGFIWAEKHSLQHQEIRYPKNWWQAVKERFAPRWFLRLFPVEYELVVLDVKAIYPEFNPAIPNQASRLIIQR